MRVPDSHANLSLLVVVAIAAVVVIWLLRKQWKADPLQGEDWCFVLYLFAAISLVISFLPPPDFVAAGRSGSLSPARLALVLGLAALVLGGLLHLRLARRGALIPWERRRRYVGGVALAAAIAVAYALAERAGFARMLYLWVPLGFVLLTLLLVGLWALPQVARFWFAPGQRIARCHVHVVRLLLLVPLPLHRDRPPGSSVCQLDLNIPGGPRYGGKNSERCYHVMALWRPA